MSVIEKIAHPKVQEALSRLAPLLHGKDEALIKVLACVFSRGHLLLEDLPGLGKTTLAVAVANMLGLDFGRVQCTNDLLPTDVTGLNVYKMDQGGFEFHPGPVFNHILLVDEINRATPKTQSALLEAMGEQQTTIDGKTYHLPRPFFVIATQNPVEHSGTFPLPESQMDRFMMRISLGYPLREAEKEILRKGGRRGDMENIHPLFSPDEIISIQDEITSAIKVSDRILDYLLDVVEATRKHERIAVGISTRGGMALLDLARALAWMQGRDYVIPEDIKLLSIDVLSHRIHLRSGSDRDKPQVIQAVFEETPTVR